MAGHELEVTWRTVPRAARPGEPDAAVAGSPRQDGAPGHVVLSGRGFFCQGYVGRGAAGAIEGCAGSGAGSRTASDRDVSGPVR
ncbi:hypothetical protein, partial [Streptomyces sp. NPDC007000]|uniref:hypothetical protein n=1 Tax=Streptomyces sp. NPDC007000 TaxID=3155357 RepID=UPI003409DE26